MHRVLRDLHTRNVSTLSDIGQMFDPNMSAPTANVGEHDYEITEHARHGWLFQFDTWTCTKCGKNWIRRPDKAPPTKEE